MTQPTTPLNQQPLNYQETDNDWLNSDLSLLEEYEPYDWGDVDPLTLGKAVKYLPDVGFVIEGEKNDL